MRAAGDGEVSGGRDGSRLWTSSGSRPRPRRSYGIRTPFRFAVLPGEHVTRGKMIGYVGQSGRATGPHLHYEVRVHNVAVNPHKYLRSTYEQIANLDGATPAGQGQ